jgi:hypothetical protein
MMIEASPEGSPGVCSCVYAYVYSYVCTSGVRVCTYGALCLIYVCMMYVFVYPCTCVRDWCVYAFEDVSVSARAHAQPCAQAHTCAYAAMNA